MILIELEGGRARRFRMEFHPRLTVVEGFNAAQRKDMIDRLRRAITGEPVGLEIAADVDGTPHVLDGDVLAAAGLVGVKVDCVLRKADLPGTGAAGLDADDDVTTNFDEAMMLDVRGRLETARRAAVSAIKVLRDFESQYGVVDEGAIEQLVKIQELARDKVGALRTTLEADPAAQLAPEEKARRITYLRGVEQSIVKRVAELKETLEPATATYEQPEEAADDTLRRAGAEWQAVNDELASSNSRDRVPSWLLDQARNDLNDARKMITELELRLERRNSLSAEEVQELEVRHRRARKSLFDAETVWKELEASVGHTLEDLKTRRIELYQMAVNIAGRELGINEVADVFAGEGADETNEVPVEATPEESENHRAFAAAVLDLGDVRQMIRDLQREPHEMALTDADRERVKELNDDLTKAEADERRAGERLAKVNARLNSMSPIERTERLQELWTLRNEQDAAGRDFQEVEAEMSRLQRRVRTDEGGSRVDGATDESIETYVLARAAGLRRVGRLNESIPLLVDGAFDDVSQHLAEKLMRNLARVGSAVQVIYFSSGGPVDEWVKAQDEQVAMAVGLEVGTL